MEQNTDLAELVTLARTGNSAAYGLIVRRFQDMAYAGGYAWLGDVGFEGTQGYGRLSGAKRGAGALHAVAGKTIATTSPHTASGTFRRWCAAAVPCGRWHAA